MKSQDRDQTAGAGRSALYEALVRGFDTDTRDHLAQIVDDQVAREREAAEGGDPGAHRTSW